MLQLNKFSQLSHVYISVISGQTLPILIRNCSKSTYQLFNPFASSPILSSGLQPLSARLCPPSASGLTPSPSPSPNWMSAVPLSPVALASPLPQPVLFNFDFVHQFTLADAIAVGEICSSCNVEIRIRCWEHPEDHPWLSMPNSHTKPAIQALIYHIAPSVELVDKMPILALLQASSQAEVLQRMVQCGTNTDVADKDGWTALHWSARDNYIGSAHVLADAGANINSVSSAGYTPLIVAAYRSHIEFVNWLLRRGADISPVDQDGDSVLLVCASKGLPMEDLVLSLVNEYGADGRCANKKGQSVLIYAAFFGMVKAIRAVVETARQKQDAEDEMAARIRQQEQQKEDLCEDVLNEDVEMTGGSDLQHQRSNSKSSVSTSVNLSNKNKKNNKISKQDDELKEDEEINKQGCRVINGYKIVDAADSEGHTPLLLCTKRSAASEVAHEACETLIELGADVNKCNSCNGHTPLIIATAVGAIDIAKLLLAKGADVNAKDSEGDSALLVAIKAHSGELAEEFLRRGADPNVKNSHGETPLDMALYNKDEELAIRIILMEDVNLKTWDKDGDSPLMIALSLKLMNVIDTILDLPEVAQRVDIPHSNHRGNTALIMAAYKKFNDVCFKLLDKFSPSQLDINAQDDEGDTALLVTCGRGLPDVAKRLIEEGADVFVSSKAGRSVLRTAVCEGYWDVCNMVCERMSKFADETKAIMQPFGLSMVLRAIHADREDSALALVDIYPPYLLRKVPIPSSTSTVANADSDTTAPSVRESLLVAAAMRGMCELIERLVGSLPEAYIDAPCPVNEGRTPLKAAILAGQDDAAMCLLATGASTKDLQTSSDSSPVVRWIKKAAQEHPFAKVSLLNPAGAVTRLLGSPSPLSASPSNFPLSATLNPYSDEESPFRAHHKTIQWRSGAEDGMSPLPLADTATSAPLDSTAGEAVVRPTIDTRTINRGAELPTRLPGWLLAAARKQAIDERLRSLSASEDTHERADAELQSLIARRGQRRLQGSLFTLPEQTPVPTSEEGSLTPFSMGNNAGGGDNISAANTSINHLNIQKIPHLQQRSLRRSSFATNASNSAHDMQVATNASSSTLSPALASMGRTQRGTLHSMARTAMSHIVPSFIKRSFGYEPSSVAESDNNQNSQNNNQQIYDRETLLPVQQTLNKPPQTQLTWKTAPHDVNKDIVNQSDGNLVSSSNLSDDQNKLFNRPFVNTTNTPINMIPLTSLSNNTDLGNNNNNNDAIGNKQPESETSSGRILTPAQIMFRYPPSPATRFAQQAEAVLKSIRVSENENHALIHHEIERPPYTTNTDTSRPSLNRMNSINTSDITAKRLTSEGTIHSSTSPVHLNDTVEVPMRRQTTPGRSDEADISRPPMLRLESTRLLLRNTADSGASKQADSNPESLDVTQSREPLQDSEPQAKVAKLMGKRKDKSSYT